MSEILLPLLFAAVLAVVFKPVVVNLEAEGSSPPSAPDWSSSGFSPS